MILASQLLSSSQLIPTGETIRLNQLPFCVDLFGWDLAVETGGAGRTAMLSGMRGVIAQTLYAGSFQSHYGRIDDRFVTYHAELLCQPLVQFKLGKYSRCKFVHAKTLLQVPGHQNNSFRRL